MGRRGSMRTRPGLLFIVVFAACLIIFYLSWRSIMSPAIKIKDTLSEKRQNVLEENDNWRNKVRNREGFEIEVHDRDPDYHLIKDEDSKVEVTNPPPSQFELPDKKGDDSKSIIINKQESIAPENKAPKSNTKEFYRQPNAVITKLVKPMERLVHLDLKGAPPKISYFKDFFPLVKKLGATGLLIEYEDMFPYSGKVQFVAAKNAYSMTEIKYLLELASANNLKVMPLVQTFGHMEFALKSEGFKLRESEYTPQVIAITKNASYELISEMINQVLNAHPDATYLHIGCDEVYELGKGVSAIQMKSKGLSVGEMFLQHVKQVANIVSRSTQRNVRPVMWDDELRKFSYEVIQKSNLPALVDIMIWRYTPNVPEAIGNDVWNKYAKLFKHVWIASAFKGATGPRQFFTEPQYHIKNHFSWLDAIEANKDRLTFKGVALTGWQRYDHLGTLCELLPVAVPSLAACLLTMENGGFTEELHKAASSALTCSHLMEMTFPEISRQTHMAIVTQDCRFPGHELYYLIQQLYGVVNFGKENVDHRIEGWLSDYQIAHNFSNTGQLRVLANSLTKQSSELSSLANAMKTYMDTIYFKDTIEEWLDENIQEKLRQNEKNQNLIQPLLKLRIWGRRPFTSAVESTKQNNNLINTNDRTKMSETSQFDKKNDFQLPLLKDNNQRINIDSQEQKLNDQNKPYNNKVSLLRNQQTQLPDNQPYVKPKEHETIFETKILTKNTNVNQPQDRTVAGRKAGEDIIHGSYIGDSNGMKEDEIQDEKKLNDAKDFSQNRRGENNANKENIKLKEDTNGASQKVSHIDENNRYRGADVNVEEKSYLPDLDDLQFNPKVVEDDRLRREKYLNIDKNDNIRSEQKQPILKIQESFKDKSPPSKDSSDFQRFSRERPFKQ